MMGRANGLGGSRVVDRVLESMDRMRMVEMRQSRKRMA